MKKFWFLISLALLTAPLSAIGQESFKIKKSLYSFELKEKDGKCVLNYAKKGVVKELALDVPSDCKVVRMGASGQVVAHYYKDIKATVIMVGGELSKGDCKGEKAASTQAILIGASRVWLGKKREGTCITDGPDEKEFWLASH